jgi:hypothetical protein
MGSPRIPFPQSKLLCRVSWEVILRPDNLERTSLRDASAGFGDSRGAKLRQPDQMESLLRFLV